MMAEESIGGGAHAQLGVRNATKGRGNSSMELILTSERLLFRPLAETDLDLGLALLTDPEVTSYIGAVRTAEEVGRELAVATKRCAGGCIGVWCAIDRATQEKLGTAVLLPLPIEENDTNWDLVAGDDLPDCEVEVGYILKKSAWGKGYATEACKRLLRFAFERTQLADVVAVTHPENTASQHVLRKSGLVDEGPRRAYATQCPGFRITRQQWSRRTGTS